MMLSPKVRRPLNARGVRAPYARLPAWMRGTIILIAVLALLFVVVVAQRVVERFVSPHSHFPLFAFLLSIGLLAQAAILLCRIVIGALRGGRSAVSSRRS
jgi:hypothetical protein